MHLFIASFSSGLLNFSSSQGLIDLHFERERGGERERGREGEGEGDREREGEK